MRKLLLLPIALLFLVPFFAVAADTSAFFSATAPVIYEDGSAIGPDDTLSYFLYCGTTSGTYTIAFNITPDLVNGGENIGVGLCVSSP